jgi:hypothetical protein
MTRPWIEFVQAQRLPWTADDLGQTTPGIEIKMLSRDVDTGAASVLIRYPAGWSAPATRLGCDLEFFVLEGELDAGARRFGAFSYAHWPAGFDSGARSSSTGAVVLAFLSAAAAEAPRDLTPDTARLVEHLDAFGVPYTGNFHPEFPPGAGRKLLWQDPETGDTSWLLGTLPMRWAERVEVHPVVEEMFLLAGESHGNRGVMRPGAYFWRPGGIPHGPYGTLTGNLYFFRTKGGGLNTQYVDGPRFRWWPPYDPALPDELKPFAGEIAGGSQW